MQTANSYNVFITGGDTPLGRELTRQLVARGHRVTGVAAGSDGAALVRQDGGIPAFVYDASRPGEMRSLLLAAQADVALHLEPQRVNGFPVRGLPWEANRRALSDELAALLQAAEAASVKFFVYPSYTFLYGDRGGSWVDEDTPLHETPLFREALDAEDRVRAAAIPACVLRAGTLYGPGEDSTEALIEAVKRGRGVYTGDKNHWVNWIHLADLAAALALAVEQMPHDRLFNVTDGTPAALAAFIAYLAAGLGLPTPGQPPALLRRALVAEMQQMLLDSSVRVRSVRIRQQLGWTPRYGDYRAGLDQTLLAARAEMPVQG